MILLFMLAITSAFAECRHELERPLYVQLGLQSIHISYLQHPVKFISECFNKIQLSLHYSGLLFKISPSNNFYIFINVGQAYLSNHERSCHYSQYSFHYVNCFSEALSSKTSWTSKERHKREEWERVLASNGHKILP